MCEADAFILVDGREKKIFENIDQVEVEGDGIRMINIFGEQKILRAKIRSYNNTERKILVEAID